MPRPPKSPSFDEEPSDRKSIDDIIRGLALPPEKVHGKPNPDWYREVIGYFVRMQIAAAATGNALPFNSDQAIKSVESMAKFAGLSMKDIQDRRSPEQRMEEATERLLNAESSIWEEQDAELQTIVENIAKAEKYATVEIERRRGIADLNPAQRAILDDEIRKLDEKIERGKAIRSRINRVLRLREKARSPGKDEISELLSPLLFMLYVFRTDTDGMGAVTKSGIQTKMLRVGYHHVRMYLTIWMGTNGVILDAKGIHRDALRYTDIVLVAPPGHGKSQVLTSYIAWDIFKRRVSQWAYIHAKLEMAQQMIGNSKAVFDTSTAVGRRAAAIFPGVRLADRDNNKTKLRIHLDNPPKSPTLFAAGVTAKSLGADTDRQAFDDVVPQSDLDQPTERERRKNLIGGTWTTRQRGKNTVTFHVGYMWHPEDYLSDMVDKIQRGKIVGLVDIQRCGGPTPTEHGPAFWSLWPEVYPPSELRRRFEKMRNRAVWSANYEANPLAEEMQIIRKLRYYDPTSEEHTNFMASGMFHVSVDPSATNRETSDKAGLIYAGIGEVLSGEQSSNERRYEVRVRVIDAQQNHVNQVELADHVARYSLQRPVFQVHVETRSGYHATADIIENKYGLVVQRHDPTNIKKLVRLKQCAGVIDDALPGLRAVVEFPGTTDADGNVVPDHERWGWLYPQFLKFGYAEDHCCDALTQLILHFIRSGELAPGEGEATQIVRKAVQSRGDGRLADYWKQGQKNGNLPPEEEDARWSMEQWR